MNKKSVLTVGSVLLAVLLMVAVFCLLLSTYSSVSNGSNTDLSFLFAICLMFTATYGIYYILAGCKKGEGSKYYVWFMGAMAVCDLILVGTGYSPIISAAAAVSVASCTVLCFAKDLGVKKSSIFAALATVMKVLILVLTSVSDSFTAVIATDTLLAFVAMFMVAAKYYDKSTRGSK